MNSFIPAILVFALIFSASACSEKKPLTETAVKGDSIISQLEALSRMYERKNLSGFMNLISDDFKDRKELASSLQTIFSKYENVRATIHYTKMLIMLDNRGAPKADFNWDSEWQTAGGAVLKNSGRAAFIFDPKETKLVSMEGKNPFIPSSREAGK